METAASKPEVFTRKASGLVRVMSPYSAFVYNILTMGLIFPWTYLWAPGALPGGKLVWGILLAMVIEIPIAFVYVWLSTALPRSGGDYVFQSRVFGGGVAFTVVMSGFVIWILQWVGLSGWLVSYLGFAPLFLGLGATLHQASLSSIGVWFTTGTGIIIVSILNALIALVLLVSGFKNYVRFQHVIFWGTILCFATVFIVFFTTPATQFVERLNAFAVASGGSANWYQTATAAVEGAGIDLHPPFSLIATLLIAPIAWTSLQWATYSAEQNGEIKDARSFQSQSFIMVGSLIATGLLLALLAVGIERVSPPEFLTVAGAGYWSLIGEASINGFNLWPPIIAVALTASPLVVLIIGAGYLLNGFQIVCNCYIGMTRVLVAMSLDRVLPEWFSKVDEKLHTPVNAHLAYFLASIPVILAYNLVTQPFTWTGLTLGVTFGCGYVFIITCLAGALLPFRAKEVYEASPGAKYQVNPFVGLLLSVIGVIGFIAITWTLSPQAFANYTALDWLVRIGSVVLVVLYLWPVRKYLGEWVGGKPMPWLSALSLLGGGLGMAMVVSYLLSPSLGVLGSWDFSAFPTHVMPQVIAFGIIIVSWVWYLISKSLQKSKGINVDYAFKEIPPE
ncbi:MAG TPA: APC family permease [Anaerolineales bacterium]|nr:APC family permease [Anaerolineales bacterium]